MPRIDLTSEQEAAISAGIIRLREAHGVTGEVWGELVAEVEGRPEGPYGQSAVTNWEKGLRSPPLTALAAMERITGRIGEVTSITGWIPADAAGAVLPAIERDPDLSEDQREMLAAAYRAAVRQTKARRNGAPKKRAHRS